ncbi:DUF4331 domain-containing protein [Xylophilus sp. Kf1]|nr:DUF4331 domain-containing protein [Xylophilus sp. Kf1]
MKLHKSPLACLLPLSAVFLAVAVPGIASASSHREAPYIAGQPRVDASDFYMFNSYEPGRAGFVTLIANYQPLQAPYGGPNYFQMDPNALYEIHVDNNGDGREDVTFQFRFTNTLKSIALPIGGKSVPIPLIQAGAVNAPNAANLNVNESFTVTMVQGDRRTGSRAAVTNTAGGSATFAKPVDNIGTKTIPDYTGYAAQHIYNVNVPGCGAGKLFVGQRKDPFAVNLGVVFDLVHADAATITDPSKINAAPNSLDSSNVTSLALEVPVSCVASPRDPVIGGWTTSSVRQGQLIDPTPVAGHITTPKPGGAWTQVSRLGQPLVNELVIGLPMKDRFNGSKPSGDAQFIDYVTNPTLPALLDIALGIKGAPTNIPRNDLVTTFLTGIKGVNQPLNPTPSEVLRLNTSIAATPAASQGRLGVAGGDNAGYPNGRRPKDDVVDISLAVVEGGLCVLNGTGNSLQLGAACNPSAVPLGMTALKLHDAVDQAAVPLLGTFPYLFTPTPGAQ